MNEVYRINKSTLDDIGSALREANNTTEKFSVSSIGDKIRELAGSSENKLLQRATNTLEGEITEADLQGASKIMVNAFYSCTGITGITIPNSVTSIGEMAFYYCTSLATVNLGNGLIGVGKDAFKSCSKLSAVNISNLADWCKINFSSGDANPIRLSKALYINGELITGSLTIPNNVTKISDYSFYLYDKITSLTIENGLTSIGSNAFNGAKIEGNLIIPDSVKTIGNNAFDNAQKYTNLVIGNGVTTIGGNAFYQNYALTDVVIGANINTISNAAFQKCTALERVTIYGTNLNTINNYAFGNCSALQRIKIYAITPPTLQAAAFNQLPSTCVIEVPASAYEQYISATNWSNYADQIVASEEF